MLDIPVRNWKKDLLSFNDLMNYDQTFPSGFELAADELALSISGMELGNVCSEEFSDLAYEKRLQRLLYALNFSGNRLSFDGLSAICYTFVQPVDSNLSILLLDDNRIGNDGALLLAKFLHSNFKLLKLSAYRNKIGDEGAEALAEALMENNTLRYCNLNNNKITNKGCASLTSAVEENVTLLGLALFSNSVDNELLKLLDSKLEKNRLQAIQSMSRLDQFYRGAKKTSMKGEFLEALVLTNSSYVICEILDNLCEKRQQENAFQIQKIRVCTSHCISSAKDNYAESFLARIVRQQSMETIGENEFDERSQDFSEFHKQALLLPLHENKVKGYLNAWEIPLNCLYVLHRRGAPICVVKADDRNGVNTELIALRTLVPNAKVIVVGKPVSNSFPDVQFVEMTEIRGAVNKLLSREGKFHNQIPLSWVLALDDLSSKKQSWMSYATAISIASRHGVTQVADMLEHFHKCGVLIYFKSPPSISEMVIIEPKWFIDRVIQILQGDIWATELDESGLENDMDKFKTNGMITIDLLNHIWTSEPNKYILDVMNDHLLLSQWSEGIYVIPKLINPPSKLPQQRASSHQTSCRFEFQYLPHGVFERIATSFNHYAQHAEISQNVYTATLGDGVIVLEKYVNTVHMYIEGSPKPNPGTLVKMEQGVLKKIKNELAKLSWEVYFGDLSYIEAKRSKLEPWF